MQSVQLPNVGILQAKKGRDSDGAGVGLKAVVKYENIGRGTKRIMDSGLADSVHDFGSGMKHPVPA